jgi:hypothetical protein
MIKRKSQHDGLAREEFDEIKIRKTQVEAPASSNITVNLPSNSGTLTTTTESDSRYVRTGSVNQTIAGSKRFDDLGFTGTAALQWTQPFPGIYTNLAPPNITSLQHTFVLPTYATPIQDDIVARTATQTLTNKTVSGGTFTNQSMFTGTIYGNNSISYPITRSYKSSATSNGAAQPVINYQMVWPIGPDNFGVWNSGTYLVAMALQSGDFGLLRGALLVYVEVSGFAGGKASTHTIVQHNIHSVTISTGGLLTITLQNGVTPNTTYEFTQTQVCY